jgi:7-cyano-7-deazaguanine synthase
VKRAIVLLSGGLDSATCLLLAREEGYTVYAMSFDYGQKHALELQRARALAGRYGAREHRIIRIDFPAAGASALTDRSQPVPKDSLGREEIPATYVPARNMLFLAHAVAWGEALGVGDIFIGANALDYSGYPDCRPEFLESFAATANLATKAGSQASLRFRILAPLLRMTKAQIVLKAASLGLDFAATFSCYDPSETGRPCGRCDSCLLRAKGFSEARISDPLIELSQ